MLLIKSQIGEKSRGQHVPLFWGEITTTVCLKIVTVLIKKLQVQNLF